MANRRLVNMRWVFFIIATILAACQPCKEKIKVACVGDSITEGYGIQLESSLGYPVDLDKLLGNSYTVLNAGRSATTLQKEGNFPYWITNEFSNVFAFEPDVIVLMLGTNDTKPVNWNPERYKKDYQALIDTLQTISSHPKIDLCIPVPVFKTNWGINDSTMVNGVIPIVTELAKANDLTLIDLYKDLENQKDNFPDGVHPNAKAAMVMAKAVAGVIQGEKN